MLFDWSKMTDAAKRQWALEQVGIRLRTDSIANAIADAEAVVAYINGLSVSALNRSDVLPDLEPTTGTPVLQPLGAT